MPRKVVVGSHKSWLIGRLWCWEGLGAGEGDDRGWDGWMASPTRWTWVNSRTWWWTGRPGVLQFMESQSRTRLSDWTELNIGWVEGQMQEVVGREEKASALHLGPSGHPRLCPGVCLLSVRARQLCTGCSLGGCALARLGDLRIHCL